MEFADRMRAIRQDAAQRTEKLERQERVDRARAEIQARQPNRQPYQTEAGRTLQIAARLAYALGHMNPPRPTDFVLRTETYKKESRTVWTLPPHKEEVDRVISRTAVNGWALYKRVGRLHRNEAWNGTQYFGHFAGIILGQTGTVHNLYDIGVRRTGMDDRSVPSEVSCRIQQLPNGQTSSNGMGIEEVTPERAAVISPNLLDLMARLAVRAGVDEAIFE